MNKTPTAPAGSPVHPQVIKQPLREDRVAVLASFTLFDPDHHSRTVDVLRFEPGDFADPESRRIGDHQQKPMLYVGKRKNKAVDLFSAQHFREIFGLFSSGECQIYRTIFKGMFKEKA